MKPIISLVVAMSSNRVIGKDNKLPWHLPEDLQHFKTTTMGHTMVMGRKTFDSISRPLPGRKTIVVTRDVNWRFDGAQTANSLEQAIALASADTERSIFIVGGTQIYRQALDLANCVIATEIAINVDGDAKFPELSSDEWSVEEISASTSKTGLQFAIKHYKRISSAKT